MKAFNGLVLLLALLVTTSVATADPGIFNLTEVAPGVFVHHGRHVAITDPRRADSANLGVIVGTRCVAVIDTGGALATGLALRQAVAEQSKLPVCYVINTHVHFDHVLGNAAFVSPGTVFVGHKNLRATLDDSRQYFVEHFPAELGTAPVVGPTTLVETQLKLDLGEREIVLSAQPDAHTSSDLTVLDVATNTLFAGDLLFMERLPVLDGSIKGWLQWLAQYRSEPFARVVPGHGPVAAPWPAASQPELDYLQQLVAYVRNAIASGSFLEDAVAAAAKVPTTGWILTAPHSRNVSQAYREFEWE